MDGFLPKCRFAASRRVPTLTPSSNLDDHFRSLPDADLSRTVAESGHPDPSPDPAPRLDDPVPEAFARDFQQSTLARPIAPAMLDGLVEYAAAGHAMHWEEPQRFARDLSRFIVSLAVGAATV